MVHHRDLGDNRPHGYDGVSLGVDDRCRSQTVARQAIERVGADGAALARGKDEHAPGHALALQRVARLDDHARVWVHAAQEANGVR